jgi:hypothetical protein
MEYNLIYLLLQVRAVNNLVISVLTPIPTIYGGQKPNDPPVNIFIYFWSLQSSYI